MKQEKRLQEAEPKDSHVTTTSEPLLEVKNASEEMIKKSTVVVERHVVTPERRMTYRPRVTLLELEGFVDYCYGDNFFTNADPNKKEGGLKSKTVSYKDKTSAVVIPVNNRRLERAGPKEPPLTSKELEDKARKGWRLIVYVYKYALPSIENVAFKF